jgi:AAA+ ATPase superfamily predicted ATPase
VYGRRRVGKSRLVTTALEGLTAVYYLADDDA